MVPPVSIGPGGWGCCADSAFLPFFPDAEAAAGFFRSPAPSTTDEADDEPPRINRIDPWGPWRCNSSAAAAAFFRAIAFSFDLASLQTGQCLLQKPPECSVHSLRLLTVKQWDVQPGMVVMVGTSRAISKVAA